LILPYVALCRLIVVLDSHGRPRDLIPAQRGRVSDATFGVGHENSGGGSRAARVGPKMSAAGGYKLDIYVGTIRRKSLEEWTVDRSANLSFARPIWKIRPQRLLGVVGWYDSRSGIPTSRPRPLTNARGPAVDDKPNAAASTIHHLSTLQPPTKESLPIPAFVGECFCVVSKLNIIVDSRDDFGQPI
jgi:hypothetical protein